MGKRKKEAVDALVQRVLDVHDTSTSSKKKRRRRKKSKSKGNLANSPTISNNECIKDNRGNGLGLGLFGPLSFVSLQEAKCTPSDAENEESPSKVTREKSGLINAGVEEREELEQAFDQLRENSQKDKSEQMVVERNDENIDNSQSNALSEMNESEGENEGTEESNEDNVCKNDVRVEMFSDESGISSIRSESGNDQCLEMTETNNNVDNNKTMHENEDNIESKDNDGEENASNETFKEVFVHLNPIDTAKDAREDRDSISTTSDSSNETQPQETLLEETNESQVSRWSPEGSLTEKKVLKRKRALTPLSDTDGDEMKVKKSKKDGCVEDDEEGKEVFTDSQDGKEDINCISSNNNLKEAKSKEILVTKRRKKRGSLSKESFIKSAKSSRKRATTSSNSDQVEIKAKKTKKAKLTPSSKTVNDAPVAGEDSDSTDLFKRKRYFGSLSPLRRLLIDSDFQINCGSIGVILQEMASTFEMDVETCLQSLPKRRSVEDVSKKLSGIIGYPKIRDEINFPIGTKLTSWFKKNNMGVTRLAKTTLKRQPFRHLRKELRLELEESFEDFKNGRFKQEEEIVLLHSLRKLLKSVKVTDDAKALFEELEGEKRHRKKDKTLTLKLWLACYLGKSMLHYRRPFDIYCQVRRLVFLTGAKSTANHANSEDGLRVLNAIKTGQMSYDEAKKEHSWINTVAPRIRTVDDLISGSEKQSPLKSSTRSSKKKGAHKSPENETDEVIEDIIKSVVQNIGWSAFSSCQFDQVDWREVDESREFTLHKSRRLFRRNIQPVLQTHFAGEDIRDMSWQEDLLQSIVSSTSIKTRLDIDWKELLLDFPLQTTQSLIQFVENQYYSVIRRFARESEELTREQMWNQSYRFKEALEKAYYKRMKKRERSVALAELSVQLAVKRAEHIVEVVEQCKKQHANDVKKGQCMKPKRTSKEGVMNNRGSSR